MQEENSNAFDFILIVQKRNCFIWIIPGERLLALYLNVIR
ncbi:hypothetical protein CLD_2635 [Clostridium botulinum B1 str. Okra]|uniref:Uncharacterized protein n=1 Tax=Clostridium botulinum (strain Okra / Type B1) TaxID=498213 RepID=B1IN84_CLOBK|nr:hypothetical protein CLD_2635 [Clostridium botulinum B1 str. Okra]